MARTSITTYARRRGVALAPRSRLAGRVAYPSARSGDTRCLRGRRPHAAQLAFVRVCPHRPRARQIVGARRRHNRASASAVGRGFLVWGIPSELAQPGRDPRLDLYRFRLRPARKHETVPDPARPVVRGLAETAQTRWESAVFGRGNILALSIRWSESSWSTTVCSHSLRIGAICCSCRLPRRRKCPDISRPSYSTQFQPIPTPRRSRPSENRSTSAACLANRAVGRCGRMITPVANPHSA